MASKIILKANAGFRGRAAGQLPATYNDVQSVDITWSWGARPASGVIVYASDQLVSAEAAIIIQAEVTNDQFTGEPVAPGSFVTFYGICEEQVATDSSSGQINTMKFVDMRKFLEFDQVFGYFNRRVDLLVDGLWQKYYTHLLPQNQAANFITYTATAFTAAEILDFCFTAPTVTAPWARFYHPAQKDFPVYNIDCSTGRKLSDVLTQISQRQGLVFTLLGGQWQLVWALKGIGSAPTNFAEFPVNSDNRRLGLALSEMPTAVTVFGARNRYQVLDIPMQPDWNQNLVSPTSIIGADFANFEVQFVNFVFANLSDPISGQPYNQAVAGDPDFITGNMLARARAETITLGEFADYVDSVTDGVFGEDYRDRRKFNGRTRLDMPLLVYVRLLVFRAFRLPDNFQITTAGGLSLGPLACRIVPTTLVETTYDYATGAMGFVEETAPGGNGLAIVQGFNFATPPPVTFHSDQFDLGTWLNTQTLWQRVQFQIDDTGDQTQFIILDEPVNVSDDLMTMIDGQGVVNAQATYKIPPVTASLVFEAERFQYFQGVVGINAVENVADLNADFVAGFGSGAAPAEIPFADGQFATEKAAEIATSLLLQQPVYILGGYTNRGCNGTQLQGTVDRVRVLLTAPGGLTEEVDLTTERAASVFEPERDFDRRIQLLQLAPGQADLRMDARETWGLVASLRHSPKLIGTLRDEYLREFGPVTPTTDTTVGGAAPDEPPLNAGTPLWKPPTVNPGGGALMTGTQSVLPENSDETNTPVFVGVTVRDQEPVNTHENPTGRINVQHDGAALVRVLGPASVGDAVGMSAGNDYLVSNGTPSVGILQQAVANDNVPHLVLCALGQGGGGGGGASFPAQVISESFNYVVCQKVALVSGSWVGTGGNITVSKPWALAQGGNIAATYYDGPNAFTVTAVNTRTVTNGISTTGEFIWRPYVVGEILQVSQPTGGIGFNNPDAGGNQITMIDTNQGTKKWDKLQELCTGQYALYDSSFPFTLP